MSNNKTYHPFLKIVEIWLNEYRIIFKDAGVITLFFIAVAIYPVLYLLAYNKELAKEIPIVVVDENNSELSRKLITMLDATDEVKVISQEPNFDYAKKLFDESKVYGVVDIPDDFDKKIYQFQTATIEVYADASYLVIYKQIMTAANYSIGTLGAGIEIQRMISKKKQFEKAFVDRDPLPLETYALYNPRGGYATYAMPAVLLLILQQTLLLGLGLLGGTSKEKGDKHFLAPLGVKPGLAISTVIGKSLAYYTLYFLNALYVFVIIFRIFSLPMRANYFDLFVFLTPFIFAVIFFGMSIASFFKKREHALMILLFTSIPFIFLSGFSWPIEAMPHWQVYLSQLIPSTPAIKGFLAMSQRGAPFSDVFGHWLHLWALLIVYLGTASLLMRHILLKQNTK